MQKALGEYLEKQRLQFARFYFVGDEDLLEMIGNSTDVAAVMRHMAKMFAGIAGLDGVGEVAGLVSAQAELVVFKQPISTKDTIIGWLSKVEKTMKSTLIELCRGASEEQPGPEDVAKLSDWCDKYPAMVLMVMTQCGWCGKAENSLTNLDPVIEQVVAMLNYFAQKVLT